MSVPEPEMVGISVEQTAHILSIKEESVRKHVSRGTLQAEEEREARRRADMLLARLVECVAELEASQDAPESAAPRSGGFTPREHSEGAEKPAEPRSWWRRMFGG